MFYTLTKTCSSVLGDRAILSEFNYEGNKATKDLKLLFLCVFFPPVGFLPQWPVQLAIIRTLHNIILFQLFQLYLVNPCLGFPFVFMMGSKKIYIYILYMERCQLKTFKSETPVGSVHTRAEFINNETSSWYWLPLGGTCSLQSVSLRAAQHVRWRTHQIQPRRPARAFYNQCGSLVFDSTSALSSLFTRSAKALLSCLNTQGTVCQHIN